jgi:hypothetical protein
MVVAEVLIAEVVMIVEQEDQAAEVVIGVDQEDQTAEAVVTAQTAEAVVAVAAVVTAQKTAECGMVFRGKSLLPGRPTLSPVLR